MAASTLGSVIAGSVNENSGFWNSSIRGQVSAHSAAWMRDKWFGGGRPDYGQVAADAFGNTLADFMMRSMAETKETAENKSAAEQEAERRAANQTIDGRTAGKGLSRSRERSSSAHQNTTAIVMAENPEFSGVTLDDTNVNGTSPSLYDLASSGLEDFRGGMEEFFNPYANSENPVKETLGRVGRGVSNGVIDIVDGYVGMFGILTDPNHAYQVAHDLKTVGSYVLKDPGAAFEAFSDMAVRYTSETSTAQILEDALRFGVATFPMDVVGAPGGLLKQQVEY